MQRILLKAVLEARKFQPMITPAACAVSHQLGLDTQLSPDAVVRTCERVVDWSAGVIVCLEQLINRRPQSHTVHEQSHGDNGPVQDRHRRLPPAAELHVPIDVQPHHTGDTKRKPGHEQRRRNRQDGVEKWNSVSKDESQDPEDEANAEPDDPGALRVAVVFVLDLHSSYHFNENVLDGCVTENERCTEQRGEEDTVCNL